VYNPAPSARVLALFRLDSMIKPSLLWMLLPVIALAAQELPRQKHADYFTIEVVDQDTGRGVPLVELETTNRICFYTDSAGIVAFDEPGLMNQRVFFTVTSHGYEFPKDGFGFRGVALDVKPGGSAQLKIKRINIAQRLYRITGGGIYRDSVLVGRKPPIKEPLLNALVVGQDTVYATVYQGNIHWFWGDTTRVAYPLGLFAVAGATSKLPQDGGLDPSIGVDLEYFTGEDGFARKMAPLFEQYPVWIDGLVTLKDDAGRERMVAHYSHMKSLGERIGRGLVVWNDASNTLEKLKEFDINIPLGPAGHAFRVDVDGQDFFYFCAPYPSIRVKADWKSIQDPASYQGFTPLAPGARYEKGSTKLERDGDGKLLFAWKSNTPPLVPQEQDELVAAGLMKREESPQRLEDADRHEPVLLHGGSVHWNEFRKRWIMIGQQGNGTSKLGETWYAESTKPEGPWVYARKIVTHDKMDFYNPTQHAFFDQDGGRMIYFEGTYTNTFSGNPTPTPRYEYNQIMYRLDLSDPRLKMPDPPDR
jgi:hypothetical protein